MSRVVPDTLKAPASAADRIGKRVAYDVGELVFRQGMTTHAVFRVVSGSVRLQRHGADGEFVPVHVARPGEYFAEAAIDSRVYHCDAITLSRTTLHVLPIARLREQLRTDPAFALQWIGTLTRQLRASRARVERLSLRAAHARVGHLIVSEGRDGYFVLTPGRHLRDVADELGLSPETLYRTLAAMQRQGTIERGPRFLRLLPGDKVIRRSRRG